jgi:hypothetical protein
LQSYACQRFYEQPIRVSVTLQALVRQLAIIQDLTRYLNSVGLSLRRKRRAQGVARTTYHVLRSNLHTLISLYSLSEVLRLQAGQETGDGMQAVDIKQSALMRATQLNRRCKRPNLAIRLLMPPID